MRLRIFWQCFIQNPRNRLSEYNRVVLEALREPLEEKEITINRLSGNYRYPCNFMFVASMNPCPCGYYGDEEKDCKCLVYCECQ